jgi:hypothetical protein
MKYSIILFSSFSNTIIKKEFHYLERIHCESSGIEAYSRILQVEQLAEALKRVTQKSCLI